MHGKLLVQYGTVTPEEIMMNDRSPTTASTSIDDNALCAVVEIRPQSVSSRLLTTPTGGNESPWSRDQR